MFQFFSLFIIIYDLIIEKGEYQPWMFQLETERGAGLTIKFLLFMLQTLPTSIITFVWCSINLKLWFLSFLLINNTLNKSFGLWLSVQRRMHAYMSYINYGQNLGTIL